MTSSYDGSSSSDGSSSNSSLGGEPPMEDVKDEEAQPELSAQPRITSVTFSEHHDVKEIPMFSSHSFTSGASGNSERKDVIGPLHDDDPELGRPPREDDTNDVRNSRRGAARNHRISHVTDMATGKQGGARYHHALVRSTTACAARSKNERIKRQIKHFFHIPNPVDSDTDSRPPVGFADDHSSDQQFSVHGRFLVSSKRLPRANEKAENEERQYRLKALRPDTRTSKVAKWFGFGAGHISIYEQSDGKNCQVCGLSPNNLVMKYLHWSFRRSFTAVFLSAAVCFFSLTILFAVPIWAIGLRYPTCIGGVVPDEDYDGPPGGTFMDAYELSWTTLSTVGYGVVFSGTSATEEDIHKCTGITIVVTLEAFVGVLFCSMCGAILFAKVARIQSFAQVTFSDPMVIRYGPGVSVETKTDDQGDDGSVDDTVDPAKIPCPVLEFRINNNLHSTVGGEIIDAAVNIVASIDASQIHTGLKAPMARRRRGKKGKKRGAAKRRLARGLKRAEDSEHSNDSKGSGQSLFANGGFTGADNIHQAIEEDPTGYLVPRRIFSKLEVESPDHPFFKRVWIMRHRLDENSPLLKSYARQMVRRNRGYWPRELNNYELVRESIYFDQILVSLSGTSNADANAVYAQKAYDFVDVCVGYRFVNQLYRDQKDGSLRVDTRLVSDVTEQAGGGGEPLNDKGCNERRSADNMMVL